MASIVASRWVQALLVLPAFGLCPLTLAASNTPATDCAVMRDSMPPPTAGKVSGATVAAGQKSAILPAISTGSAHSIVLGRQGEIEYVTAPEKPAGTDDALGGLLALSIPASGIWRVSLSRKSWVDIVTPEGSLVQSVRHGGQPDCPDIRKFVEFPLQGETRYTLQLSGSDDEIITVLVSGPFTDGS